MKRTFYFLFAMLMNGLSYGQDSSSVTFSEEPDTLVKQRFIDRYENVFMTKVPTRQIFKLSTVGSQMQGSGINFAYEYKVLPSISLEASVYSQLSVSNQGLAEQLLHFNWKQVSLWANAKARWYYNMAKRIREGLNANNFSGTYVGVSYEQSLGLTEASTFGKTKDGRVGLLYGFQSRFFNRGHMDFSVGLFQKEVGGYYEEYSGSFKPKNFMIGTQAHIGLAFGDWAKTTASPFCDVLICDESIQGQWKVEIPNISVRLKSQVVRIGSAYERKIGNLPVSASAAIDASYYHFEMISAKYDSKYLLSQLELRYYFLQRYQVRHGKTGSNFSGPYAGAKGGLESVKGRSRYAYQPDLNSDTGYTTPVAALLLGYQQRLFKRIYFDGSIFWQKRYKPEYGTSRPYISSKMGIGFTF